MSETITIESTGTLHKVRDPEGASYRFVTDDGQLTSAVIFREGDITEESVARYSNVKFTAIIEIEDGSKEYGFDPISE